MWASILGAIVKPVADLIDDLHTSDEEKANLRMGIMAVQVEMGSKLLEYETKRLEAQQKVIEAEAKSGHLITSMWRPVTMLTFLGLIVSYWLGYTPENVSPEQVGDLMDLIKLGLGGYVIGRSAEKVVPQVAQIFKKDA
jgi:hypothetical protein